jgi:hypothetical protein
MLVQFSYAIIQMLNVIMTFYQKWLWIIALLFGDIGINLDFLSPYPL